VKQIYVVNNEFQINKTEGRWNVWIMAGQHILKVRKIPSKVGYVIFVLKKIY
jgi:hypothetical protein